MSDMDDALAEMKPDIDAIEDKDEQKAAVNNVLDIITGSDALEGLKAVVQQIKEYVTDKDPEFVNLAHALATNTADIIEAQGFEDFDAYKASELQKVKTLADFAAAYDVDANKHPGFIAFRNSTNTLLTVVEKLSGVADDKYDDAATLIAAAKEAFPERKGNPLRKGPKPGM